MNKWKKRIATALLLVFILPQTWGSAEAATGTWKKDAKGYWYSFSDGTYAKNQWLTENGKQYYFKSNGYMAKGWLQIGKDWYYFNPSGAVQKGWKKIGGKWYYFQTNGIMVTGTTTINGESYTFDANGVWIESGGSGSETTKTFKTITFGAYEQDNNSGNGKEAIEWIVLDEKSDGSKLVVSKYALDRVAYDKNTRAVTWETSELRAWLNNTFYKAAFSSAEQAKILTTSLVNEKNPYTGTSGGNNTNDKMFVLSLSEAQKYFGSDQLTSQGYTINVNRACKPTAYAKANHAMTYSFSSSYYGQEMKPVSDCCWYWLRTPGSVSNHALYCNNMGGVGYANFYVWNMDCAVRPAMWVKP